jgi:hypothetical protein
MADEVPAWEACKENVLPIKRGRSVKGLSAALSSSSSSSSSFSSLAAQEKVHEEACESAAKGGSASDVLDRYCQYIKWVRDAFPTQQEKTLKLLERATHACKDEASLKNDVRLVKIWIEYADSGKQNQQDQQDPSGLIISPCLSVQFHPVAPKREGVLTSPISPFSKPTAKNT